MVVVSPRYERNQVRIEQKTSLEQVSEGAFQRGLAKEGRPTVSAGRWGAPSVGRSCRLKEKRQFKWDTSIRLCS